MSIVTAVNDAPVSSDTSISVQEGTVATGTLPPAFDVENSPVTYGLGANPVHGTVTIDPDGNYTYQRTAGSAAPTSSPVRSPTAATSVYTVTVSVGAANGALSAAIRR